MTRRVLSDPFITLRFVALSLETSDEQGQALNGIVRAMLARGDKEGAKQEIGRIEDPLWNARSLAALADHYESEGDDATALDYLAQAVAKLLTSESIGLGGADLLRIISKKQGALGQLEKGIATAGLIPDPLGRVSALQQAASATYIEADGDRRTAEEADKVLLAAFEQAKNIEDTGQDTAHIFIDLGEALTEIGDLESAAEVFTYTRSFIADGQRRGRDRAYARLAAAMIGAEQLEEAMEVVREVEEGPEQVRGVSAVARALAERGDIDAAPPLFTLARESAEVIEDPGTRNGALTALVEDQTWVGRFADAFTTAGAIDDRPSQSLAMMRMGEIFIALDRLDAAEVALDYIPYMAMRIQLMARLALAYGRSDDVDTAADLIGRAFEPTGFETQPEYLPDAVRMILDAHLEVGDPDFDSFVFTNVRNLAALIEDELTQVAAMARLATAEALRGEQERANRTLSSAWRNAWLNRDQPEFPEILAGIVEGQIAVGDVLSAFDTAARIPTPEGEARGARTPAGDFTAPRFASLTKVAEAAATGGETDLAIRAAREIRHPPARAAGLAAIAVALAEAESDGDGEDRMEATGDDGLDEGDDDLRLIEDPFQN